MALVHLDRTEPGVLAKAIAEERVPAYELFRANGTAVQEMTPQAEKRAGGTGRGKTRAR